MNSFWFDEFIETHSYVVSLCKEGKNISKKINVKKAGELMLYKKMCIKAKKKKETCA